MGRESAGGCGGDRRGTRSAGLSVVGRESDSRTGASVYRQAVWGGGLGISCAGMPGVSGGVRGERSGGAGGAGDHRYIDGAGSFSVGAVAAAGPAARVGGRDGGGDRGDQPLFDLLFGLAAFRDVV